MPRKKDLNNFVVTKENKTGRNEEYAHRTTGMRLTRAQMVNEIENNNIANAHIRVINGVKTPVTNPDGNKKNNLG